MRLAEFDYELPADRIAQEPAARRDAARLMALDGATGRTEHHSVSDLPNLLSPGDLLVVNDTRVMAARLRGRRASPGTGGKVEALLVRRREASPSSEIWEAMVKGAGGEGDRLDLGPRLRARVAGRAGELFVLDLRALDGGDVGEAIAETGTMPLPPYIERAAGDPRDPLDRERYQTIFATVPGAVAAPTASLHFTPALVDRLVGRGVRLETLTLHVGPGTFQPVRSERVEDHQPPPERFILPERLAAAVARVRREGGRVVAVGTTVTRTLESRAVEGAVVAPGEGECDLFIVPGHRFRVVDLMMTNFHLPRSSLLMLVAAFAGRETILKAYAEAVHEGYRFYSYGDAMLLTPSAGARS